MIRRWGGGTESFVANQIEFLQEFEPAVFSHRAYEGSTRWREKHVMTSDLTGSHGGGMDAIAYALARSIPGSSARLIRKHVNGLRPDVIHVHYLVDAAFFAPVLRSLGIPVIVSAYGYDVSEFPGQYLGLGARYLRRSIGYTSLYLAMSEDMKKDMLSIRLPEAKVRVHYFGINSRRFALEKRESEDAGPFRMLITGRLVAKKGHAVLLRSLQILRDSYKLDRDLELRIVGDGPLQTQLEGMSRELSLSHQVHFIGHLPYGGEAMLSEHAKADLFVLPSLRAGGNKEGIPGALLEAMASGIPVISTFHAGIPDIVESEKHGLLVPEGDAEALARALHRLIVDKELRRKMADAAALRAAEFDVRERTLRLELLYKTLLTPGTASGSNDR
jgi:colanic acid/amylovoran biosynthesis glycosyltransferase